MPTSTATHPGTLKLERHDQGDKHPSSLKEQTINAARGPLLGPTSPKLDLNNSAKSTLPRVPSSPTYTQHLDTVEHHTESGNEKSDLNSDEDVNFNLDHNLGSLRHSGSLNSTIPQSEDIDRENYILNVYDHVERPCPRSITMNLDLLDIKTSTHNPNLLQPSPLTRQRSHSSSTSTPKGPGTPRITLEPSDHQDEPSHRRHISGKTSTQSQKPDTAFSFT